MCSTSIKIAFGYILLIGLLFGSIGYIYRQMTLLTSPSEAEAGFRERRKTTNLIISKLYQAEIIGQTLRAGKFREYARYQHNMRQAGHLIDSLQSMLSDTVQKARLDTVRILLLRKEQNMILAMEALRQSPTDELYKQQLDSLITEQDSILSSTHVRRKIVTHRNTYTIHHKPKKFFRRLADVFAPGKPDSTQVNNVVKEEYTDTIDEAYNPVDTIATMLTNIQHRVFQSRQEQQQNIETRINQLRIAGGALSRRVSQLLQTIESEEQAVLADRMLQEQHIRQQAANTMAAIAILAVILVLVFSFIIWRDITRSNHYRKELEKAKLYAENLLAAREKLMLTITHDIKAPAGSILGYIDLLIRLVQDKRQAFYLHNMKSSARHLIELVTSLLDFHRLEAGKMDLHTVAFNPHELFSTIYTSFRPIAEKKQLSLLLKNQTDSQLTLQGDPFRIRQITENLLSNALKFTEKGEITLETKYAQGLLSIHVSDTGCGMNEQEKERVFQAFTRLKSAQGQEGFGLGLSITRKLVELLSGSIHIDSSPGYGSTFSIILPLSETARNDKSSLVPTQNLLPNKELKSLALIDDDRIQLTLTETMIRHLFAQYPDANCPAIHCCTRPEELFRLLKSERIDLILTDIQMPAMNGFELLDTLRKQADTASAQIPVVAITARSDMHESAFLEKGFAGCLHKPFCQNDLIKIFSLRTPTKTDRPLPAGTGKSAYQLCKLDALTAFSADDPDAAKEIIRTFAEETAGNLSLLQTAIEQKDTGQIGNIAHKMLPTFTMIEATSVIPALQWLETNRHESSSESEIFQHAATVINQAAPVLEYIRRLI